MAKLHALLAPISCLAVLASSTACTGYSTDRYAQGEVVCKDAASCDAMWTAAERWITENSALKLERSTSLLETRCGMQAESFACYTVTRQPRRTGETHISIYIACGNDYIGCEQPATRLRNQLTAVMVGATAFASAEAQ